MNWEIQGRLAHISQPHDAPAFNLRGLGGRFTIWQDILGSLALSDMPTIERGPRMDHRSAEGRETDTRQEDTFLSKLGVLAHAIEQNVVLFGASLMVLTTWVALRLG